MNASLLFPILLAGALQLSAEPLTAQVEAAFHGTSTLHDFDGHATAMPSEATWTPEGQGGTLSVKEVHFTVKDLSTDHEKRDKNMMKMFEPDSWSGIVGVIQDWQLTPGEASEQELELQIHGTTVQVPVQVTGFEATEQGYRLICDFELSLKACDLKRPSVLGLIRVGDTVTLHVETELSRP
jgi:hypothetical protein